MVGLSRNKYEMVACPPNALCMRIGIDARLWNQGGVGRYIRNLVINLHEIDKKNSYVLFVRNEDKEEIRDLTKNKYWEIESSNSDWHSIAEQLMFPRLLNKEKLDLMHFTYHSVPIFYRKPYVVTIHDLVPYHFPTGEASTLPLWLYGFKMLAFRLVINNAANFSKRIIAVSKATKEEISDHLITNKQKIEVVYEAADDFAKPNSKKTDSENYFLYVGNVYPHKNAEKFLEAFGLLLKEKPNLKLVFAGRDDAFYEKLRKRYRLLEEKGNLLFELKTEDEKLGDLYENAICLIRPSFMEGFSLPPVEAVSCNCLVLLSDIPVHKELFGEKALYFDPENIEDILEKMKNVLSLSSDQKEAAIKGLKEKIKDLSWKNTARQTLKIYESCLSL